MIEQTKVTYARAVSVVVASIATLTLAGWVANLSLLKSLSSDLVTMKVNTACSLLMAAGSLLLHSLTPARGSRAGGLARTAALVPIGIGTLTLVEHFTGSDLGIDDWLQPSWSRDEPTRMSRSTASCLALSGAALYLLPLPRMQSVARVCCALVLSIALATGLAYAFRIAELSTSGWFQPMALHTSVALVLLSSAMLSTAQLSIVRSYRSWPMLAKIVLLLLITSLAPFLLFALVEVRAAAQQILDEQAALLAARADQLAHEIDSFQVERRDMALQLSAAAAALGCCDGPATVAVLEALVAGAVGASGQLTAAALFSTEGDVRASSSSAVSRFDRSLAEQALRTRTAVGSPLYVQRVGAVEQALLAYAAPILQQGRVTGVAVLWVSANELWRRMRSRNGLAGVGSFAVLLDEQGIRIAHTYRQELVYRPAGALSVESLEKADASERFGAHTRVLLADVRAFPEQFARARSTAPDPGLFRGLAPATGSDVYGVARRLETTPWTLFYMIPESSVQAQLAPHTDNRTWFAGLFAMLALLLGGLFARALVRPMQRLSEATARLEGDGAIARVEVESDDELGRLGMRFNDMAERIAAQAQALRNANEGLERNVQARTAELAEREQDLATTLHSIGDAVIVTDLRGRVERMNPQAERLTGWTLRDALYKPITEVFVILSEETGALSESPVARVLREGVVVGLANHTVLVSRFGVSCPISDSAAPIFRQGGELRGVVLVFRNVEEERRAQLALRDSERRYRELYEHQPDLCAIVDPSTEQIVECNQVMTTRLGYTKAELIGRSLRDLYSRAAIFAGEAGREAFQRTGRISDQERSLVCKDGSLVETSLSMNATSYAGRSLVAAVWRDISARKQAERDQLFLLALGELQRLGAPELLAAVGSRLADHLQLARLCWLEVDDGIGCMRVQHDITSALPALARSHPVALTSDMAEQQRAGRASVSSELARESAWSQELGLASTLLVPLSRDQIWAATLLVGYDVPHAWAEREVMLVRTVAERAWLSAEHMRMRAELSAREKAELTRQSEARVAALINSVTDYAIFQLDRDGRVASWNRGAQRIKGYAEHEVIGRHVSLFYTEKEGALAHATVALLRAKTEGRFEEEGWRLRKDGSRFWANVVITPLFDTHGELEGYAKVTRDHTERRRSAEALELRQAQLSASLREREVLLQEIHHRVKNNLQVISSLLNMQMRQVHDPHTRGALEESRRRVEAIALIHEKLYQSLDFNNVQFSDYVKSLAANVFHAVDMSSTNVKLELVVEPVSLAVDKAIPFGLVLNELITNTLKHGFPEHRTGVVRVELRHADRQNILLVVTDDGIGIPANLDLDNTPSLGMQLISTLVKQLRGQLDIVRAPGTSFRIRVPVEVAS